MQTLDIETESGIYQIQFGQVQIEITGRCNLRCYHCRAAEEEAIDASLDQIVQVMRFARRYSPTHAEVIASGGEPLIHRQFEKVMELIRVHGGESVTLTTNGYFLDQRKIRFLSSLNFRRLMLSVSLDSLKPAVHDSISGRIGAHKAALKAIRLATQASLPNTIVSIRATLRPEQLFELEDLTDFAFQTGCQRINFSSIHPSGRTKTRPDLWMNKDEIRRFIETVFSLQKKYPPSFQIGTNDPLKCLLRQHHDVGNDGERVFDGCAAGAVTFNVSVNGDMTPCALMDMPIMNIIGLEQDEIASRYKKSPIIHNLLEMNVGGKCGTCELKFQCGGCRARALTRSGDYLAEDPCCWK